MNDNKNKTVLVVDDDVFFTSTVVDDLKLVGFDVITSSANSTPYIRSLTYTKSAKYDPPAGKCTGTPLTAFWTINSNGRSMGLLGLIPNPYGVEGLIARKSTPYSSK